MIAGIFHPGSGLGNQLHRYVATRVLALQNRYQFGMVNAEGFKGKSFMDIDTGLANSVPYVVEEGGKIVVPGMRLWEEKKVVDNGVDIRSYDPEFNFVADNTIIDGEFQDSRYFELYLSHSIRNWLKVKTLVLPHNLCVIGFRGGEYAAIPELFLTRDYWEDAVAYMRTLNENMQFQVHTDDPTLAKQFFPDFDVVQNMALNWRSVRYAPYLIIANSSFYILPALLNTNAKRIIAPRYWARRNTKVWAMSSNYYRQFMYL